MPESRKPTPEHPVARYIVQRRHDLGLTQEQLAQRKGRFRGSIGRLERGHLPPSYTGEWVSDLAALLQVSPEVFIMTTGLPPSLLPPPPHPDDLSPARRALLAILAGVPEQEVERFVRVAQAFMETPPPHVGETPQQSP